VTRPAWLRNLIIGVLLVLLPKLTLGAPTGGAEEVITQRQTAQMYKKEGDVRFKPFSGTEITAAEPQPVGFDEALRTLDLSGAALRFTDLSELRLKERTRLEIIRQPLSTNAPALRIYHGAAYISGRGRVGIPIETPKPYAQGAPKGTEFLVTVDPDGNQTTFTMFDGEVELSNGTAAAPVPVRSGQQGIVVAGQPIKVVPILQATNIIQWWIYYPGVLDLEELELSPAAHAKLTASLAAYRDGSLAQALEKFPGYPQP